MNPVLVLLVLVLSSAVVEPKSRFTRYRSWNSRVYPLWRDGDARYKDCWTGGEVTFDIKNDAPTLTGAKATFNIDLRFPENQTMLPNGQVVWARNCSVNGTDYRQGQAVYPEEVSPGVRTGTFPDGTPFTRTSDKKPTYVYVWKTWGRYWQVADDATSSLTIGTDNVPLGSYNMEVVIYHCRGKDKFIPLGYASTQFSITDQIPFAVTLTQMNDVNQADQNFIQNRAISFSIALHDPSQYLRDSDVTFNWDFGDNSGTLISREASVTHTYLVPGSFRPQVILQALIPNGCDTPTAANPSGSPVDPSAAPIVVVVDASTPGAAAIPTLNPPNPAPTQLAADIDLAVPAADPVADDLTVAAPTVAEGAEVARVTPAVAAAVEAEEAAAVAGVDAAAEAEVPGIEAAASAAPVAEGGEATAGLAVTVLPVGATVAPAEGALAVEVVQTETEVPSDDTGAAVTVVPTVNIAAEGEVVETINDVTAPAEEGEGVEAVVVNEAPAVEAPVVEAPVVEAPAVEALVVEAPVVEAPVVEAPVVEAPVVEAPVVEAPVVEAPVVEAPVVEAPVVEAPVVEAPAETEVEADAEPQVALVVAKRQAPEGGGCFIYRFGSFSTPLNIVEGIESVEIVQVANVVSLSTEVVQNAVDLTVTCQGSLPNQVCTVVSDADCLNPVQTACNEVTPSPECQIVLRRFFNDTGVFCINVSLTNDVSLAVTSARVSVTVGSSSSTAGTVATLLGVMVLACAVGAIALTYRRFKQYRPLREDRAGGGLGSPGRTSVPLLLWNLLSRQSAGENRPLLQGRVV